MPGTGNGNSKMIDTRMVSLATDFLGFTLKNPLALTEGPLSNSLERILSASESDAGIIFTKGIQPKPSRSWAPYIRTYHKKSLINADWTDIGFDAWLDIVKNVEIETPLVVSISNNYAGTVLAAEMAVEVVRAGAKAVSFVDYDPAKLVETVRRVRKRIKVPIMVKLAPFIQNLEEVLKELVKVGVDAIAAMDSVGPVLAIDYLTGAPLMGSEDGSAYLSGEAILPITLKYIYEIARYVDVPVLGVGGVSDVDSAVQMIMAGAAVAGMVTAPLVKGLRIFTMLTQQLRHYLAEREWHDLSAVRGITHRILRERIPTSELKLVIDWEKCNSCGVCEEICYVEAIALVNGRFSIDQGKCVSCGLCASVCSRQAIHRDNP
jgi:dihydroorotate dehydrogenase (NAD+) catalytic subunit